MLKKFGDDLIKHIAIEYVRQSTEITNELLSAAVQRDSPETGYEKFHLINFEGLETPLEESIIERIKAKLTKVQDFTVSAMDRLTVEGLEQMVLFAAEVIEQH